MVHDPSRWNGVIIYEFHTIRCNRFREQDEETVRVTNHSSLPSVTGLPPTELSSSRKG